MTYMEAQKRILEQLKIDGWKVEPGHATDPYNEFKLWFHPQSIHAGSALASSNDARSLWLDSRRVAMWPPEKLAIGLLYAAKKIVGAKYK